MSNDCYFLQDFNNKLEFVDGFIITLQYEISRKSGESFLELLNADGQTDTTKLMDADL
jgi:hypothetical protein